MIHLLLLVSGGHVTDRHFPLWFWNQIYLYGPGTLFTKSPLTSVTKHLPLHLFSAVQVVQPVLQKSERKSAVSFFSTTNFNWLEITAGSVYFLLRLFLPVVNWAFVFCDRRRPSCRGIAGIWTPICRWIIAAEKCTAFALSPMLRSGIFSSGKAIQGSGGRFWDMGGRWADIFRELGLDWKGKNSNNWRFRFFLVHSFFSFLHSTCLWLSTSKFWCD